MSVALVLAVLLGVKWTLDRIQIEAQRTVHSTLTTVLRTTLEAVNRWARRQETMAGSWAGSPAITRLVFTTLNAPRRASALQSLPALPALRGLLHSALSINDYDGFWILTSDGFVLASDHAADIGPRPPAGLRLSDLASAFQGQSLLGEPSGRDSLRSEAGPFVMFALAPVRDEHRRVIAVLAFRLDPEGEFSRIVLQSRIQESGEAFIYDRAGALVSERHARPGMERAAPVRTTARDLVRPSGIDLEGYRDPTGRLVVGAWDWDENRGLGVAAEMSAQEAYQVVSTARRALGIALGVVTLLFFALAWSVLRDRRRAVALAEAQRRLGAVLESTTDFVCFADREGRILYVNDAGRTMLGVEREPTDTGSRVARPSWVNVMLRPAAITAATRDGVWSGETTLLTLDGRELTVSQVMVAHRGANGTVEFFSTIARDMTERARLERRLYEEKERAQVTLGSIADAVITTDASGLVEYLNPVAEQLTGWPQEEAIGQPVDRVFKVVNDITREPAENPVLRCMRERHTVGLDHHTVLLRRDGKEFSIDDSAAPIRGRDGNVTGAVMVFHDVSQARSMARRLAYQATHDFLTGLVNRHEFEHRLSRTLARARVDRTQHALCYLDLDQFKVVNDTCGHVAGDELLRQIGVALRAKVRRRDTLARLGGDEFGILMEHCEPDQALRLTGELLDVVRGFRFTWEGRPFTLRASVGVAPLDGDSESVATVLRDADTACYAAKESGRNRVHVYQPHDAALALRHGEMQWVSRITEALDEDRFRLYAQLIVPLGPTPERQVRCEVLIRLRDQDGQLTAPGAFIPAAERYNLMATIDRWVVHNVVAFYAARPALVDGEMLHCSINLSGASLSDPGLLDFIRRELDEHEVSPRLLCFEITETAAIAHLADAVHFIKELRRLGCSFALDDFGSGMSSFGYLQNLPVDFLKIAGNFSQRIERDAIDYAMVEAINRVGHVMSLKTVAEGVESAAIIAKLREIGVDYVQGYAVAGVVPIDQVESVLSANC